MRSAPTLNELDNTRRTEWVEQVAIRLARDVAPLLARAVAAEARAEKAEAELGPARSTLFLAPDADGDATLWRPNGEHPIALVRARDVPTEAWTLVLAALAAASPPEEPKDECPACSRDRNLPEVACHRTPADGWVCEHKMSAPIPPPEGQR